GIVLVYPKRIERLCERRRTLRLRYLHRGDQTHEYQPNTPSPAGLVRRPQKPLASILGWSLLHVIDHQQHHGSSLSLQFQAELFLERVEDAGRLVRVRGNAVRWVAAGRP